MTKLVFCLFCLSQIFFWPLFAKEDDCGPKVLNEAAGSDKLSIIVKCLTQGTHAYEQDELGNTAIHHWAQSGKNINALALLVYRGFGRFDIKNKEGESPMDIAIKFNNKSNMMAIIGLASLSNPVFYQGHWLPSKN